MLPPPKVYPGAPLTAVRQNQALRFSSAGQISGGAGMRTRRSANGSVVTAIREPKKRTTITVGGAVVVTEEITYTDTPVQVPLEPLLTNEILAVPSEGMTDAGAMMDLASASPEMTVHLPGNYLLHYRATCGYAESCAQALNLSDCVTRLRLKIGGVFREETEVFGTHHAKLCASGLVRDVGRETGDAYEPFVSGEIAVSGDEENAGFSVLKVAAYNRWTGGKATINGTFQLTVVLDSAGDPKIAIGLPEEAGEPCATCAPTVGLWVDRSAIEPDPGVAPLGWLPAVDTELTLYTAQIHLIRLI